MIYLNFLNDGKYLNIKQKYAPFVRPRQKIMKVYTKYCKLNHTKPELLLFGL